MTIEEYSKKALARATERHATADSLLHNAAGFTWNPDIKRYEIEVRGHIVAALKTIGAVEEFCDMHNARLA